ncbi:hypothetical protein AB0N89_12310 [Amycolatopsis sp. NPDC089917]|uniref:hypothetical protein n=1 Tax=Amycolatopsis sp. NPDC089917 TaxID=3155187 RepID=UPI0034175121
MKFTRSCVALIFAFALTITASPAAMAFDPPKRPNCGDTVYLVDINSGLNTARFRVVGVGLSKWLGGGGYGTLHFSATAGGKSTFFQSSASAQSGARSGLIVIDGASHVAVHAWLDNASGTTKCEKYMSF